ncbi:MAG: hypothetical protein K2X27_02915 [Candidatus Obscuribacterales bacterium]|nr:hypothetical protein [Candidatus Obscuribacterales bacterium]
MNDDSTKDLRAQTPSFVRSINGVEYLDEIRWWQYVSSPATLVPRRLSELMRLGGVRFWDEEDAGYNFVREPKVLVTGFGGFKVGFDSSTPEGKLNFLGTPKSPEEMLQHLRQSMGVAGFWSYGNPSNLDALSMDSVTSRHGHYSKTHLLQIDLAILGYSAAIEGNFMLLRRWFNHVERFTNTRCLAQCSPPLLVMDPADLEDARALRAAAEARLSLRKPPARGDLPRDKHRELVADFYERVNALWPNSRALILGVDADLSNLRGCMGNIADLGQEREARQMLALVNDSLRRLFPDLFKHSSNYGYDLPRHWSCRAQWEMESGQESNSNS